MREADVSAFLDALRGVAGVSASPPAPRREIERVEAFVGARLPEPHRALLLRANGLTTNFGYERLFGVGDGPQDIGPWNADGTWKFAWPKPLQDYLAIGQTGWGDQLAYRLTDLRRGIEAIHWLDGLMVEPGESPVADSFEALVEDLAARARTPDEKVQEARRQIGDLGPNKLAVFWPPPLLIGLERAAALTKMPARAAMIINGDLATQLLDRATETRRVDRIELYLDNVGRPRVRVRWAWVPSADEDPGNPLDIVPDVWPSSRPRNRV
jgi:SMI1 / KNR4 family (SUKH-1)